MTRTRRPTEEAARILTTLALRPDLSCSLSDDHLGLQADYDRLVALERVRTQLQEALDECQVRVQKVQSVLDRRVAAARFGLQAEAFQLGRAA